MALTGEPCVEVILLVANGYANGRGRKIEVKHLASEIEYQFVYVIKNLFFEYLNFKF